MVLAAGCGEIKPRWERELSGKQWKLYLDKAAEWEDDTLYLPPVDLSLIPVNPPTCGWEALHNTVEKAVEVPGTVEGYYWSVPDRSGEAMGDYRGVSWWSTTFDVPRGLADKRLMLAFESVNLRAEVFVNKELVGYDLIGNTPFELDITGAVQFGEPNTLDVRITDVGGTFSWDDERAVDWGGYKVPSVHGFGGITGKVRLYATGSIHIDDIYVQNQPVPAKAKIFVMLGNTGSGTAEGTLELKIRDLQKNGKVVWSKKETVTAGKGSRENGFQVSVPNARLWQVKDPYLYAAEAVFTGSDGLIHDRVRQDFGFRFMSVGEKDGDARLYFNGKRIFLLAAMTRGFWPKTGMFPIEGMAERDIRQVIDLGYNMIMYHRAIGQPASMDLCDEMGILTYEEPGGYQCLPYPPTEFARQWRREKLRRMILRDRSRASLTNWNLDDWSYNEPNDWDFENIRMVHELDPSRIVTFNCIQPPVDSVRPQNPFQLHMRPFDSTYHYDGWFDPYHFAAQQGYVDEYYNNPEYYARYVLDPDRNTLGDSGNIVPEDQVYFLGEEGAFGTQLNLERIKADLDELGADGWMDKEYLDWYESYDRFLTEAGLRDAFPTVEDLTMKMGHNLHYFHGRIIENTRMMNIADGYVLNGWAGASTNTDIVDTYRHPTGDPSILPYYSQPLYVAVKIRNKVIPAGSIPVADVFIINETDLRGDHELRMVLTDPDGDTVFSKAYSCNILGGEEFGQLLFEEVRLPPAVKNGHYHLNAELADQAGLPVATGYDALFVADYVNSPDLPEGLCVIDGSGMINSFLRASGGLYLPVFDPQIEKAPKAIVVGEHDINRVDTALVLDMVRDGTRLIILENAEEWLSCLPVEQFQLQNTGRFRRRRTLSGRQFVGCDSLFEGLPQAAAMSWEYQVFYRNGGQGLPISPEGINTIVGVGPTNTGSIGIAMCEIPYGKGEILLSTLEIVPNLVNDRPDCSVAKKLFMNILAGTRLPGQ